MNKKSWETFTSTCQECSQKRRGEELRKVYVRSFDPAPEPATLHRICIYCLRDKFGYSLCKESLVPDFDIEEVHLTRQDGVWVAAQMYSIVERNTIQNKDKRICELEAELENCKHDLEISNTRVDIWRKYILKKNVDELEAHLINQERKFEEEIAKYEKACSEKNSKIKYFERELDAERNRYKSSVFSNKILNNEIEKLKHTIRSLESACTQKNETINQLEERLKQRKYVNDSNKESVKNLRNITNTLFKNLSDQEHEIEELQRDVDFWKHSRNHWKEKHDDLIAYCDCHHREWANAFKMSK